MATRTVNFDVSVTVYESGRKKPSYDVDSDLTGRISLSELLNFTKSSLIVIADEVLREEQSKGFDKNPIITVDGNANKSVANVSPLGKIEIYSRVNMRDIVLETYKSLLLRSPVLTGRYKSSHFVFLNGTQVATDLASLEAWLNSNPNFSQSDLVRFVDIQPYARKLERLGVTAGRTKTRKYVQRNKRTGKTRERLLQPNGTYYLTSRAIRAKYKNNSIIKFTFISGSNLGIKGSFKVGRRGKPGRAYLYPSIIISVQERGIV